MKHLKKIAAALALTLTLSACGGGTASSADQSFDYGGGTPLRILSGSENKELADILDVFSRDHHINIEMDYAGSLDIMRTLQGGAEDYDAVWPASSIWLNAGDTGHKVKHAESVSLTPVVFGIRQSLAEELGFVGREVSVGDILQATQTGKLRFCMTSATQSNSGCSAYIGFLYAMLGSPDIITADDLTSPTLAREMTALLAGVDRSSGSSDWLKELFLSGSYDAMVNYECLIISANRQLEAEGKETLYTVYPYDGLSLADSPLGYVDNGRQKQEDAFLTLQEYLLSDEVQAEIQRTGRRTGYEGVLAENSDVFRADWGIQASRVLSPNKMPAADVLFDCLNLYQTELKKPSLTVYCLDYSGSMRGEGRSRMVEAMEQVLIQKNAAQNFLQASENEITIVIPFDSAPRDVHTAAGNGSELEALYPCVEGESAGGGTDIYAAAADALDQLSAYDLSAYTPAVILLTDGQSDDHYTQFCQEYKAFGQDVPIFSIMFGDADPAQLNDLATLTNARVFDGRKDLVGAFRSVKGYN